MHSRMKLGLMVTLLLQSAATAQTWDGGGATNNWTDGANWNPNNPPANNGTATPNFAGNVRLTPVVNVNYDINGITFDNQAGAFNILSSGGILTTRGGGITNNNASVTQTISTITFLGAPQTFGGVGSLTYAAPVGLNSNTLSIDTPKIVRFDNAVNGAGSIVKNGTGALVLFANNGFTGGVTHNEGILAVGLNASLGTGTLTINGGTFEGTGGNRTLANTVVVNNDFGIVTGTGITFSGQLRVAGQHMLTNNITNLAISGSLGETAPGGELTLAGTGTLTLSGTGLTLGTSLKQNSGTLTATGLINSSGRTLTQNGGAFTGSLINRGSFVYNGGTHSGNIANEGGGDVTINNNLTLTAALANAGTLRVASGRTLTFGSKDLNNTGTLELAGGSITADGATSLASSGIISGFGTINTTDSALDNSGQVSVSGGNLTLNSNVGFASSGTISVPNGRQLIWNSDTTFSNDGLIELTGGAFAGTGPLANNGGGQIRGSGAIHSALTNSGGLVRASAGNPLTIANLASDNNAGGELRVDDGATLNVQSAFNSSGSIVLAGLSAALNLNSVTNTGTVRGLGRVTGTVLNNGVVRAEGGTLTFASPGNTNAAAGRLEAGVGDQLFYTQGLSSNAGTIALTGGALDNNNNPMTNPGRIEGYGTLRTGGLVNAGVISVGGSLDVLGSVNNSNVVSTKTGSNVRFFGPVSGAGSFTGTGTVTFLNTFAPGISPASVRFDGDVEFDAASNLEIELGGTTPGVQYDELIVLGDASLGGALDVELIDGFVPAIGSTFQFLNASGGVNGSFSSASLPAVAGRSWQLDYQSNAVALVVTLAGDYNADGQVDAADYTRWRDSLGQTGVALAADGDNDGQVGAGDYAVWKANFGQTAGGSASGAVGVPEPPACCLLLVASMGLVFIGRPFTLEAIA